MPTVLSSRPRSLPLACPVRPGATLASVQRAAWVALLGLGLALAPACKGDDDDDSSTPTASGCASNPWGCATGTTCWPSDATTEDAPAFACLPSAASQKSGAACTSTVGKATCGDALACYELPGSDSGQCVAFCDDAHPCAPGHPCTPVAYAAGDSAAYSLCLPLSDAGGVGGAGGTGGAGGASGASGSAGSATAGAAGGGGVGTSGTSGQAGSAGSSAGAGQGGSDAIPIGGSAGSP